MYNRLAAIPALMLITALSIVSCGEYKDTGSVVLKSPDNRTEVKFELKAMAEPYPEGISMYYQVKRDDTQILRESPLGLNFGPAGAVFNDLVIIGTSDTSGVDQFDTPFSKRSSVKAEYNEMTVTLRQKTIPAKTFSVIFRAYNDGVAFRYAFPKQEPDLKIPSAERKGFLDKFVLTDEMTGFYFPVDVDVFAAYTSVLPPHNYERWYLPGKLSQITRDSTAALPLLAIFPDGKAVCFAEADLEGYPASYVHGVRNIPNALATLLIPLPGEKEIKTNGQIPFVTPWRVLMIADQAGKLIESDLILSLSKPSRLTDVSWIKPGKASWDWWSGKVVAKNRGRVTEGGFETSTYEHYIRFAAEARLQYCLIDAGWYGGDQDTSADITKPLETVDMPRLVQLADSLGIKLILWVNWERVDKQIDQAFPLYQQWGIAGVKIDYMDRDDQEMVDWYRKVVEKAAQYKLLVDFHGAFKPDGLRRTWPNLITREAVIGLEYLKWSNWANPEHNVTIPYTRMLVGPMDYTPGGFQHATAKTFNPRNIDPVTLSTRCHQLAMFVVYESPLQVLADSPSNYRGEKGLDFISLVPTVWSDTRFLAGEVANYIVLARKNGNNWYIGAMTDENGREVEVPLDFLGGGSWKMKAWADGPKADTKPEEVTVLEMNLDPAAPLAIKMAPNGGFAAVLEPR